MTVPTLVIGLGNPGAEYRRTRHNMGWRCLDVLEERGRWGAERREGPNRVRRGTVEGVDVILARPQTYMNLSGRAGRHLTSRLGLAPTDVVVVHDDIDLPFGRLRIRRGGSAGGQKGVASLIEAWGTREFLRIRIGVGRPRDRDDVVDHVLSAFDRDERERLDAVLARSADAVTVLIRDGLDAAMNQYNRAFDD